MVLPVLVLVYAVLNSTSVAADAKPPSSRVQIGTSVDSLPEQVAEMREMILGAAYSGNIDNLSVAIQWNELQPEFGSVNADDPIDSFKKLSIDGAGREILAILIDLLENAYAVTRQGADIENNKVYVWPAFAEMDLSHLSAPQETALLQIVPRDTFASMRASGKYSYWRVAIGADGTWHEFSRQSAQ
ncbi:MAG: hypothetical protein ACR2PG_10060 [Hyphomicrobiaceae bacterium]